MKGFHGKHLRVNLSKGTCAVEHWPEINYRRFLGCRGIISYLLLTELGPGVDPLGPENKLIFALGAITGHKLIGSGRHAVGAKLPLTGGIGESEAGGYWGAELKKAGHDFLIIEGRAKHPVYLWIKDGAAEIRDARHLWGLEPQETEATIRDQLDDAMVRVACIGPGGEKLIRFACVINDLNHVAGRGGLGAVMGAKNLKAVAVRGNALPQTHNPDKIKELTRWMGAKFREKPGPWSCGTGSTMLTYEKLGNIPVRNFQGGEFPNIGNLIPQRLFELEYVKRMEGCYICPLKCKRVASSAGAYKVNPAYGCPEYETLSSFGVNCGIEEVEPLIKANELCNRLGIDTISGGVVVSFAMECFEKGLIGPLDTGGLDLRFGNADAMLQLLERIGKRQGLGDLLAEGTKIAAKTIGKGAQDLAMHVKGMEIPMHEPRLNQSMGMYYAVNPSGADHVGGIYDNGISKNTTVWDGLDVAHALPTSCLGPEKARMLYHNGFWRQIRSVLGLCLFIPWSRRQIADAMEAITGWPMTSWRLMKTAERCITLGRLFNLREGFTRVDDMLPRRMFKSPKTGPLNQIRVDPESFKETVSLYFQMLGWDEEGVPTEARLVELDLLEFCQAHKALNVQ